MAIDKPVVIKKVKKVSGHGGHHGGAWKIAYADFVTAMMAFFLLMWLLAVADMETKRGLSDYFNNPPIRLSLMGGPGVGAQKEPLPGGGEDLKRQQGELKRGATEDAVMMNPSTNPSRDPAQEAREKEKADLEKLRDQLLAAIESIPSLQKFKEQLLIDLTNDGLRIQVLDKENRPMFDQGQSRLKGYAQEILRELARLMNETGKRISISGHTDASPFVGGESGYSNWELSNDRANAARRELVTGGLEVDRVMRVVGMASTALLNKGDPTSPQNRRISITVLKQDVADALMDLGEAPIDVPDGEPRTITPVLPKLVSPIKPPD